MDTHLISYLAGSEMRKLNQFCGKKFEKFMYFFSRWETDLSWSLLKHCSLNKNLYIAIGDCLINFLQAMVPFDTAIQDAPIYVHSLELASDHLQKPNTEFFSKLE